MWPPPPPPTKKKTTKNCLFSCCQLFLSDLFRTIKQIIGNADGVSAAAYRSHGSIFPASALVCLLVCQVIIWGCCVLNVQTAKTSNTHSFHAAGPLGFPWGFCDSLCSHKKHLKLGEKRHDGWTESLSVVTGRSLSNLTMLSVQLISETWAANSAAYSWQRLVISVSATPSTAETKKKKSLQKNRFSSWSIPVQQRRSCLGGVFVLLACWVFRRHHRKYLLPHICVCFPFSVCLKCPTCSRIAQMQNRTYNLFSPSLLMRRNIQRKHHSSSISCFRADETSTECSACSLELSFIV